MSSFGHHANCRERRGRGEGKERGGGGGGGEKGRERRGRERLVINEHISHHLWLYLSYLRGDGFRQSPLKTTSGLRFLRRSTAVLKRAAPPTGSLERSWTSYTSLKWTMLRLSVASPLGEDEEARSACWLSCMPMLEAED